MNETNTAQKKSVLLPCIAACLCLLSLSVIGWLGPVFGALFRGHDDGLDPLPVDRQIIFHIHWCWTIPIGCIVAAILLWGSRQWSRRTSAVVSVAAIISAVGAIIAFLVTAFRPIFHM